MHEFQLDSGQLDILQEIANIGMGQAGARLAELLGTFVSLSVPRIRFVNADALHVAARELLGFTEAITALRQGFRCDISGEAITLFNSSGVNQLHAALYGSEAIDNSHSQETPVDQFGESLADVANLINGACLTGLFEQIGQVPSFAAPQLIGIKLHLEDLFGQIKPSWQSALLLDVNLHIAERDFKAHLLTLMTADSVRRLRGAIDAVWGSSNPNET